MQFISYVFATSNTPRQEELPLLEMMVSAVYTKIVKITSDDISVHVQSRGS